MSDIETLKAQREALEKQIEETRAELEKETAAKRAAVVLQCAALVKEFSLKPYELTGGKIPGRKPKAQAAMAEAPEGAAQTSSVPQDTQQGPVIVAQATETHIVAAATETEPKPQKTAIGSVKKAKGGAAKKAAVESAMA